jgi:hypothetical protein
MGCASPRPNLHQDVDLGGAEHHFERLDQQLCGFTLMYVFEPFQVVLGKMSEGSELFRAF